MFPITIDDIKNLSDDDVNAIVDLDAKGLLMGPGETIDQLKERWTLLAENLTDLEAEVAAKEEVVLFDCLPLRSSNRIGSEILAEAASLTRNRYAFAVDWVPGYFISKSLGFLWGGCALHLQDPPLTLFIIRSAFKHASKWFIYRREELLSHELCHVARVPLNDKPYEEHFAYQLSFSRMRRFMGNCFQTQWDAIFFVAPTFLLLAAQLLRPFVPLSYPIAPFWITALAYPCFLFVRNGIYRRRVFKAIKTLRRFRIRQPEAVLFRCVASEIATLSQMTDETRFQQWVGERSKAEIRWAVIQRRFIAHSVDESAT